MNQLKTQSEWDVMAAGRAVADVDLDAIRRNCALLAKRVGNKTTLCAVVKANAYGHGAVGCARAALSGGATWLAVATVGEARELRAEIPDVPILVLGALAPAELHEAVELDADITVWTHAFIDLVREVGKDSARRPRLHVKFDSGMGRLGERDPEVVANLVSRVGHDEGLDLIGVSTHFATADGISSTFSSAFFTLQLHRYLQAALPLRQRFPGLMLHAANSAATLRDRRTHLDMVRCGVAIYGLDPFGEGPAAHGLDPALQLRSYIAAIKRLRPGDSAGYGRTWRADNPTWLGVVPIGYADGVRRALSNVGVVLVGGQRRPIVGTVSMDNLTVDLGAKPNVDVGAPAVLIGRQNGASVLCEEVAQHLQTINYEITCSISSRVPRRHLV